MKISNPEKINRAKDLLREGHTFEEVRANIGKEFNESMSPSTLSQLNKEIKNEKPTNPIDTNILKKLINPFIKMGLKIDLDNEEIARIQELFKEINQHA